MQNIAALQEAIIRGDSAAAVSETQKLLESGMSPLYVIGEGIGPSMAVVGRLFESGECFAPELIMASRATKEVFQILRPLLVQASVGSKGRVVLGTVRGDMHDIGKNLVAAMLEGGGFEVTDLGVDVSSETFIEAVLEKKAHILGLSALLSSTLPSMKAVIEAVRNAGIREQVKIMVGGAPVTKAYANLIGADGYGENAISAVDVARRLSGE